MFFESQKIIIINQKTNTIVAHKYAVNDLYELTNSISDRAFISNNKLTNKIKLIEV